jgi:RHS repeat-associated protein
MVIQIDLCIISEYQNGGDGNLNERRYVGINVSLYAKGEAVGMNCLNIDDYTGGRGYLGKDVLGSVRGITDDYGQLEDRYEYDAFGKPYAGDLTQGMNLGYTGKPYDTVTGMYNYGYRDYAPETARFTTVDPIRDGANWFAYVNNDPVNWVDPWGLSASEPEPIYFTQGQWESWYDRDFANTSCAATSLLNEISEQYTIQTGYPMGELQGVAAMQAATNYWNIDPYDATVNNWESAANDMWSITGLSGNFTYNQRGQHQIYAIDNDRDGIPDHFVNSSAPGQYYDSWSGNTGNVSDLETQTGRPTRGLDFNN